MDYTFQAILQCHRILYPGMEPQDYCKLAYQSEFGPAHLPSNPEAFFSSLTQEWSNLPASLPRLPPEPIGNGLYRFPLQGWPESAAPLLFQLCRETARRHTGTRAGLLQRLSLLSRMKLPGLQEFLTAYTARNCPPLHHSSVFRERYHPHYRLLLWEYASLFPLFLAIMQRYKEGNQLFVAIDGRCGSGKTHTAALLEQIFPCQVFHMDDFYLPPASRAADWRKTPGGNMDFARLRTQVLSPAKAGKSVCYRPFHCRTGKLSPGKTVPPLPLTVLEGSYSHHPALDGYFDVRVFLTCSAQAQARRLKTREGQGFGAFAETWIPLEERYFAQCSIPQHADLLLDTTEPVLTPASGGSV